jgi:hypothetical protein
VAPSSCAAISHNSPTTSHRWALLAAQLQALQTLIGSIEKRIMTCTDGGTAAKAFDG